MQPFDFTVVGDDQVQLQVNCIHCSKPFRLKITTREFGLLTASCSNIQSILPDMPPADRELLISGTCGNCWTGIFGEKQPAKPTDLTIEQCLECTAMLDIKVCQSPAGYYIGTRCAECGPHSRFSGYTKNRAEADIVLEAFKKNPCRLRPYFESDMNPHTIEWLCCEEDSGKVTAHHYKGVCRPRDRADKQTFQTPN